MIQINLLPDVKLEYIKAQRLRRLVTVISLIVTAVAVFILVITIAVGLAQKKHLNDLNGDVQKDTSTLQSKPSIDKVLTVQNQLNSLSSLHSQKPAVYNMFNTYLNELTPQNVLISTLTVTFSSSAGSANPNTINITGTTTNLATVDQYVDTFKFTTYKLNNSSQPKNAFSDVVLSQFGINANPQTPEEAATYTISATFDPEIFSITEPVQLNVPSKITTRSQLEQPGPLFNTDPNLKKSNGGSQ